MNNGHNFKELPHTPNEDHVVPFCTYKTLKLAKTPCGPVTTEGPFWQPEQDRAEGTSGMKLVFCVLISVLAHECV